MKRQNKVVVLPQVEVISDDMQELKDVRRKVRDVFWNVKTDYSMFQLSKCELVSEEVAIYQPFEEVMKEIESQQKVKNFVIAFNEMKKADRKKFTWQQTASILNDEKDELKDMNNKGVHISTVCELCLHTASEVLEMLGIPVFDGGKFLPNGYVNVWYEPEFDDKWKIKDINVVLYITPKGLEKVDYEISRANWYV
ncbi:MAG: hypothetical protein FWF46_05475 [Oscillospiraceae bacterium]|nr:hypothetical protein [Oscillospiraceae bacterium]